MKKTRGGGLRNLNRHNRRQIPRLGRTRSLEVGPWMQEIGTWLDVIPEWIWWNGRFVISAGPTWKILPYRSPCRKTKEERIFVNEEIVRASKWNFSLEEFVRLEIEIRRLSISFRPAFPYNRDFQLEQQSTNPSERSDFYVTVVRLRLLCIETRENYYWVSLVCPHLRMRAQSYN